MTIEADKPQVNPDFRLAPFKQGRWKHFSHLDGLAGGGVLCLFEAADGALWFGTRKGLSRFDGQRFFTLSGGTVLPDGGVTTIAEEPAGVMWFGTNSGLCRYEFDHPERKLTTFTTADGLPNPSMPASVTSLAKDRNGRLWVGTTAGLAWFDPAAMKAGRKPFVSTWTKETRMANDAGPGGHHGKLTGGATMVEPPVTGFADAGASANHVLELDGKSGFVDLGDSGPVLSVPFTMEAWIRYTDTNETTSARVTWGGLLGGSSDPVNSRGADFSRSPSLYLKPEGALHGGFGDGTIWRSWNTGTNVVKPAAWTHVAVTFDGQTNRVYADGMEVLSVEEKGIPKAVPIRWIGRVTSFFHGQMDEVRLWKSARTEKEIRESMSRRLTGNEENLVALWNFETGGETGLIPE